MSNIKRATALPEHRRSYSSDDGQEVTTRDIKRPPSIASTLAGIAEGLDVDTKQIHELRELVNRARTVLHGDQPAEVDVPRGLGADRPQGVHRLILQVNENRLTRDALMRELGEIIGY